ncbi:MAG: polysaccharide pyruvyl transferase family protein, partial [Deltaproteobacteria bacterium]|nr:polysaccharide pyruvyl transferase family protein [Deltaproteobacteria bacterium]
MSAAASARRAALLSYAESENLGDEIQSIAAAQFLPPDATTVDRDHLRRDGAGRRLDAILNGWFLIGDEWPPPDDLRPLFVSFYAPPENARVYDPALRDWYRHVEPIGCRSTAAAARFAALGVRAYFSGCLTLCLPPAPGPRGDELCVVDCDPALLQRLVPARVLQRAAFLTHVERPDAHSLRHRARRRAFRLLARQAWPLAWRASAAYRRARHQHRMARAAALLARYAAARLVITGRLHCFLPCLALGTPVVLLRDAPDAARFAGLAELGRVYTRDDPRIAIDWDQPEPNPTRHLALAAALAATCRAWAAGRSG